MRLKRIGRGGVLRVSAVASAVGAMLVVTASASAANRIYWANRDGNEGKGSIAFANLGGGGGEKIEAMVDEPRGIALDPAAGLVFWVNHAGPPISYAPLDGGGAATLNTGAAPKAGAAGIATDPANGRIYWTDEAGGIWSANANDTGGAEELKITSGKTVESPRGLVVEPVAETIYYVNHGGTEIDSAPLAGGEAKQVTTLPEAEGIALDPTTKRIYWAERTNNKIKWANLRESGGGEVTEAGADGPTGVAIDPGAGVIYWANTGDETILSASIAGGNGVALETSPVAPEGPNFPALLKTPISLFAPKLAGSGSAVGATLSCTQGEWAPDLADAFDFLAPQSLAFSWSVNGAPIAGATSSSIVAGSAGSYTCTVTGSNEAGATAASSAAVAIAGSPVPAPLVTAPPTMPLELASITGLSVSPHKFHAASSGASIASTHTGATVSYGDSQAASTTFTVLMPVKGFKRGRNCLAKRPAGNGRVRRCTFLRSLGTFTRKDRAGHNSFRFTGRVHGHRLAAGAYLLQAVPSFAGHKGAARSAAFAIL